MAYADVTYNKKKHSSSLHLISALILLIHSTETGLVVHTTVGDDAVLPCEVDPTEEELDVEWTRPDLPPDQYVYYQRNGREFNDNKNPSYEGRTSLFMDEVKKGNVSLKLSRVHSSDAGNYTCHVPEFQKKDTVQLIVDEHVPFTESHSGGSTEVVSPVGALTWWGGLLIALSSSIIIIIIIISVLVLKRKKTHNLFGILAESADTEDRSESTPVSLQA